MRVDLLKIELVRDQEMVGVPGDQLARALRDRLQSKLGVFGVRVTVAHLETAWKGKLSRESGVVTR